MKPYETIMVNDKNLLEIQLFDIHTTFIVSLILFNYLSQYVDTDDLFETLLDNIPEDYYPQLHGGLDHITVEPDSITFHDRGINGEHSDLIVRSKYQWKIY